MSSSSPAQEATALGMSLDDFTEFNRLAIMMDAFHSRFRITFTALRTAATSRALPPNTTPRSFIEGGLNFCRSLAGHHAIEEAHIFPQLATRMPEFRRPDDGAASELLSHHDVMHEGLEKLEPYLMRCRRGEEKLDLGVLEGMLGWGDVLLTHLDEEVKALGAENMRKYWSLEEMRAMPW